MWIAVIAAETIKKKSSKETAELSLLSLNMEILRQLVQESVVFLSGELATTRTGRVLILKQVWDHRGHSCGGPEGQLLPSTGQLLPVGSFVVGGRRVLVTEWSSGHLVQLGMELTRRWRKAFQLLFWPGSLIHSAMVNIFFFHTEHGCFIPCNLMGRRKAAIDWNPWAVPRTLQYCYQLWLSRIGVALLSFTALDSSCCYEMG